MYGKALAYIVKIEEVSPIAGADRIELAKVMDYSVIVKKGEYKPGDLGLYIEVDSVLPDGLSPEDATAMEHVTSELKRMKDLDPTDETLINANKLYDELLAKSKYPYFEFLRAKKFKIKAMKMRGVISQGILFKPEDVGLTEYKLKQDFTERLGITELVQDEEEAGIITEKDGRLVKWLMRFKWFRNLRKSKKTDYNKWLPEWPGKSDEENVQKIFTKMKSQYGDRTWVVTEKLEGQNFTIYSKPKKTLFGKIKNTIGVCSRTRSLAPKDSMGIRFWHTAKSEGLDTKVLSLDGEWFCRGEHIGPGIQGNIYKLPKHEVRFFDFYHKVDGKFVKLNYDETMAFAKEHDFKMVPLIDDNFKLPETVQEFLEYSDKNTIFGNDLTHKREGVVLRLKDDYNVSFKVKNPFYEI